MLKKIIFVLVTLCLWQGSVSVYASDVEWEAKTEKQQALKNFLKSFREKLALKNKTPEEVQELMHNKNFRPVSGYEKEDILIFKKEEDGGNIYVFIDGKLYLYFSPLQTGFNAWSQAVEKK